MAIAKRQQRGRTTEADGGAVNGDSRLKAFDLAAEWAKHITTLAIGTLVLSATFLKDILPEDKSAEVQWTLFKDILPEDKSAEVQWTLFVAWALLIATALLGVLVQSALVAQLSRARGDPDVYAGAVRGFSAAQFVAFFTGIGFFAAFAGINL